MEEGYDLPGSPVFSAWKKLYLLQSNYNFPHIITSPLPPEETSTTPLTAPLSINIPSSQLLSSERVSPVFSEILVYPSASDNSNKPKNNNVKLPNFMTSESSMKILHDQKLKKARELAEKQKCLREREEKREAKKKNDNEREKEREARKRRERRGRKRERK